MEALEFLKEYIRMCTMYKSCRGCPLEMDQCAGFCNEMSEKQIINMMGKTEQWSKEHSLVTNARKFKEVFGEKRLSDLINCRIINASGDEIIVDMQKTEWWDEPYKEPEHEL